MSDRIAEIEEEIDEYLYNILDEKIPRYKFIYHLNLVYTDYIIRNQLWFSQAEKHLLFSLNYNIFLAYKKLKEEEISDFNFDRTLFKKCYKYLITGMEYSMLCDVFPAIRSNKIDFHFNEKLKELKVEKRNFPRDKHEFLSKYMMKKSLSYTLQITAGLLDNESEENASWKLTKGYLSFWNENMMYDDFEPYSHEDWGGVNLFFVLASMRRFVRLYREDFNVEKIGLSKLMVVLSAAGKNELTNYTVSGEMNMVNAVLKDYIYRPLGKQLFPKSNISDAPIIQTKDGYLILNPFVLLSNDSSETMLLNNIRKTDNKRYLKIKDKIKERVIPLVEHLIKLKFPNAIVIKNFNLPIPNKKNQKRELDMLIIDDETGFVLYVEVKHFFNPISYSEIKNLDIQFNTALMKVPDQLHAIQENWELIKNRHKVCTQINKIKAIILSHSYLGKDVEINAEVPIVDTSNFFESLAESATIEELFYSNKSIDNIYTSVPMMNTKINLQYAGYKFDLNFEVLPPEYETEFIKTYRKMVFNNIDLDEQISFKSIDEHATYLLKKLEKNTVDE